MQTAKGAHFSDDRVYRYALWRVWTPHKPRAMFIGLNPSTADEIKNDNTITKCLGFADRWGCGSLVMTNLFAFRATNPKVMLAAPEPIGPLNDEFIAQFAQSAAFIVAMWGVDGAHLGRGATVRQQYPNLKCFGVTKAGQPKHPLYLGANTALVDY
jgi:hypothetical protein